MSIAKCWPSVTKGGIHLQWPSEPFVLDTSIVIGRECYGAQLSLIHNALIQTIILIPTIVPLSLCLMFRTILLSPFGSGTESGCLHK